MQTESHLDTASLTTHLKTKGYHVIKDMKVLSSKLTKYLKLLDQQSDDITQHRAQLRDLYEESEPSFIKLGTDFAEFLSQLQGLIEKDDLNVAGQIAQEPPLSQSEAPTMPQLKQEEHQEEAIPSIATNQEPLREDSKMIRLCNQFITSHPIIWSKNMVYVPSKNYIVTGGSDGYLEVHDAENNLRIKRFQAHDSDIMVLRYIVEIEVLLSAALDGHIYLWDLKKDFEKLSSFKAHKSPVFALEYLPDLKLVLSGGKDPCLRMWQIGAEKEECHITIEGKSVSTICLLKRNKKIVVGNDKGLITGIEISNRTPKTCFIVKGHVDHVSTLTAFRNGDYLISGGFDGKIKVWRVTDKSLDCQHTVESSAMVQGVEIFGKRDLMITNHTDRKLRFWKFSTGKFLDDFESWSFGGAMISLGRPDIFVTGTNKHINVWKLKERLDI